MFVQLQRFGGVSLLLVLASCASPAHESGLVDFRRCERVDENRCVLYAAPLVQLIARPEMFDGMVVMTGGVLSSRFEGTALYLTREDYDFGNAGSAVWVEVPDAERQRYSELEGRFVTLTGRFSGGPHGHFARFSGRLAEIASVSPKRTVKELTPPPPAPPPR